MSNAYVLLALLQVIAVVISAPTAISDVKPNPVNESNTTATEERDCPYLSTSNFTSCCDIQRMANTTNSTEKRSGIYNLKFLGRFSSNYGYCDLETDDGGWIVIFRRQGNLLFNQTLDAYEEGFGTLEKGNTSLWYGLKLLHSLTIKNTWELRVDLINPDREVHAHYNSFAVGNKKEGYPLRLGPYNMEKSTAVDALKEFSGHSFSASSDIDTCPERAGGGGWWYVPNTCGGTKGGILTSAYDHMRGWRESTSSFTKTYNLVELKIRETNCFI